MKQFFATIFVFSLLVILSQPVTAQTKGGDSAGKSVKSLKKSLVKNSRYGDEVLYWFTPLKFSGCEISYRYARLNENATERFSTVLVDRTSPQLVRTPTVRSVEMTPRTSTTQQTSQTTQVITPPPTRTKVFYNNAFPYFYYGTDRRIFLPEQLVTFIDLGAIDAASIKIATTASGQEYLAFNSLKDKSAIEKRVRGEETNSVETDSDFFPITDRKSGAKLSAVFAEAVKACSE